MGHHKGFPMFTHLKDGFVVMAVSRSAPDEIEQISFFSSRAGFGPLAAATIFERKPDLEGEDVEVVETGSIAARIVDLAGDRAGLAVVADYADLPVDEAGVPLPYEQTLLCKSCYHGWSEQLCQTGKRFTCPRCASPVEGLRIAAVWTGPSLPVMIECWNALPMPGAAHIFLPGAMMAYETQSGFILVDALGNRMVVNSTNDGFEAMVSRRGKSAELHMTVSVMGIEAEEPESWSPR